MKKSLYILCCLLMSAMTRTAFAQAEATFSISPVTVEAGKTVSFSLDVSNPSVNVASAVFAIKLPEGFTLVEDSEGVYAKLAERAVSGFGVNDNYVASSNTLYVVVNGMGQVLSGHEGAVVSFDLKASAEAQSGVIEVSDLSWSNEDASKGGNLSNFTAELKVANVLKGDVNGDGKVDMVDVVALVNIYLGKTIEYSLSVCDINGDGKVDMVDVVAAINIYLGK